MNTKKALIIDDDPVIRQFVAQALVKRGYESIEAGDGHHGLQRVRDCRPSLVICDVRMEGMDGFGTLEVMRGDPELATTPFILMTAEPDATGMRQGMGLGADDYLPKPFSMADLMLAVEAQEKKRVLLKKQEERRLKTLRTSISLALPHELFTPLNGIIGYAELLKAMAVGISADQVEEMAGEILTSAERLQRLMKNYLAYAQFEILSMDADRSSILRLSVCDESGALIREQCHTIATRFERANDLKLAVEDASLRIKAEHMEKLLEEIISNAFKFSSQGTMVRVTGSKKEQRYLLSIVDHGRGMTQEQISTVGAYTQFDRQKHEQQGLGLGIAISKKITEIYGGRFLIESGGGDTCVSIELPCY